MHVWILKSIGFHQPHPAHSTHPFRNGISINLRCIHARFKLYSFSLIKFNIRSTRNGQTVEISKFCGQSCKFFLDIRKISGIKHILGGKNLNTFKKKTFGLFSIKMCLKSKIYQYHFDFPDFSFSKTYSLSLSISLSQ